MSVLIGGSPKREYEQVVVDEWLSGTIAEVQYDKAHPYDQRNEDGTTTKEVAPHVRFKFALDGYQFPHYSRWMKASTYKMANLYKKYLKPLCPEHDPEDCVVDVSKLTGVAIKIMYEQNGEYQNVTNIRPVDKTLNLIVDDSPATVTPESDEEPAF